MKRTKIEWTDYTVNPIDFVDANETAHWHCEKVSPGCANCYAETMGHRFGSPAFTPAGGAGLTPRLREDRLRSILTSKAPAGSKVFVEDMSDLFGDWVEIEYIAEVFAVMGLASWFQFQVLTKRPEHVAELLHEDAATFQGMVDEFSHKWHCFADEAAQARDLYDVFNRRTDDWRATNDGELPFRNVWIGTSIENQPTADARVPELMKIPAAVHFLSIEPMLGPVDLKVHFAAKLFEGIKHQFPDMDESRTPQHLQYNGPPSPDWVICGGESGPHARACNLEWIRNIVWQCKATGVPCFVKQVGSDPYYDPPVMGMAQVGLGMRTHRDTKGGDPSEWPEDLRVREFPAAMKGGA